MALGNLYHDRLFSHRVVFSDTRNGDASNGRGLMRVAEHIVARHADDALASPACREDGVVKGDHVADFDVLPASVSAGVDGVGDAAIDGGIHGGAFRSLSFPRRKRYI